MKTTEGHRPNGRRGVTERERLRDYVRHKPDCNIATDDHGEYINCYRPLGGCTCGLDDLLRALDGPPPELEVGRIVRVRDLTFEQEIVAVDGGRVYVRLAPHRRPAGDDGSPIWVAREDILDTPAPAPEPEPEHPNP